MTEEKTFYVGIGNKHEVRRELLECSKSIVGVLKNYEKVNAIREEKVEKIIELKNVLAEIRQMSSVLREGFPAQASVKMAHTKKHIKKEKVPVQRVIVKKVYPKPGNEIKKLEEELSEIEDRLSRMGA